MPGGACHRPIEKSRLTAVTVQSDRPPAARGGEPKQRPRSRSSADAELTMHKTEARVQGWLCAAGCNIFHDVGATAGTAFFARIRQLLRHRCPSGCPTCVNTAQKYRAQTLCKSRAAAQMSDTRVSHHISFVYPHVIENDAPREKAALWDCTSLSCKALPLIAHSHMTRLFRSIQTRIAERPLTFAPKRPCSFCADIAEHVECRFRKPSAARYCRASSPGCAQ